MLCEKYSTVYQINPTPVPDGNPTPVPDRNPTPVPDRNPTPGGKLKIDPSPESISDLSPYDKAKKIFTLKSRILASCRVIPYNIRMKAKPIEFEIAVRFQKQKRTFALAESCTGGLISHRITNVPGSSEYYRGGVVAYSNEIKISVLGVPEELIKKNGAVSRQVARAMAEGARCLTGADITAAVTGIAGPGGGNAAKPVGLAYIAVLTERSCKTSKVFADGSRVEIKTAFAEAVLREVKKSLVLKL